MCVPFLWVHHNKTLLSKGKDAHYLEPESLGLEHQLCTRVNHLLQNIGFPEPEDFRGLWEFEVSLQRKEAPVPKKANSRELLLLEK